MKKFAAFVLLSIACVTAQAESTIKEFRGSGNTTTASFTVDDPWLLDWNLAGDYEKLIALDITLIEAHSGRHVGRVLHTKRKGNGLKIFNHGGTYRFRISSTLARWTLKIKQIDPDDRDLYVPKEPKT